MVDTAKVTPNPLQNLVALWHTLLACAEVPTIGTPMFRPFSCFAVPCPTVIINMLLYIDGSVPNLVALDQTVQAQVGGLQKMCESSGPALRLGSVRAWLQSTRNTPLHTWFTLSNLVAVGQTLSAYGERERLYLPSKITHVQIHSYYRGPKNWDRVAADPVIICPQPYVSVSECRI